MKKLIINICVTMSSLMVIPTAAGQSLDIDAIEQEQQQTPSLEAPRKTKRSDAMQVRNLIKAGNESYNQQRYSEAERDYLKALEIDPNSEAANFNLASALLQQRSNGEQDDQNSPLNRATRLLQNLTKTARNAEIVEKSFYNLGNIAFNGENYAESISMYKEVLRRNPDNDKARENLRLAQKKQQEQQQNKQNQQDKQDQQQQQDQQDKQENKDQQNQDQQQQQQQQQNQEQQQQQQQQQQMSDNNAEQILKAMENAEAETRRKVEAQKAKEQRMNRRNPEKPW